MHDGPQEENLMNMWFYLSICTMLGSQNLLHYKIKTTNTSTKPQNEKSDS